MYVELEYFTNNSHDLFQDFHKPTIPKRLFIEFQRWNAIYCPYLTVLQFCTMLRIGIISFYYGEEYQTEFFNYFTF